MNERRIQSIGGFYKRTKKTELLSDNDSLPKRNGMVSRLILEAGQQSYPSCHSLFLTPVPFTIHCFCFLDKLLLEQVRLDSELCLCKKNQHQHFALESLFKMYAAQHCGLGCNVRPTWRVVDYQETSYVSYSYAVPKPLGDDLEERILECLGSCSPHQCVVSSCRAEAKS